MKKKNKTEHEDNFILKIKLEDNDGRMIQEILKINNQTSHKLPNKK